MRDSLDQFFLLQHGLPPVPAVETADPALLYGLLNGSRMLTALSRHQFRPELEAGILIALPLQMLRPSRQIGLTMREGAYLSSGAAALSDEIQRLGAG